MFLSVELGPDAVITFGCMAPPLRNTTDSMIPSPGTARNFYLLSVQNFGFAIFLQRYCEAVRALMPEMQTHCPLFSSIILNGSERFSQTVSDIGPTKYVQFDIPKVYIVCVSIVSIPVWKPENMSEPSILLAKVFVFSTLARRNQPHFAENVARGGSVYADKASLDLTHERLI